MIHHFALILFVLVELEYMHGHLDFVWNLFTKRNMIIQDERELEAPIEIGREAPPPVEIAEDENV